MKKEIIEDIPHNAVEFTVSSTISERKRFMEITFVANVGDPDIVNLLRKALRYGNKEFSNLLNSFTLDGDVYDTHDNWRQPSFYPSVAIPGNTLVVFKCNGTPLVAEQIAEFFEMFLFNMEGVYVTTRGDGTVYLDRINDAIEDEWLSRGY